MFDDRRQAGKLLSTRLLKYRSAAVQVLAIPRGGVPVGFEISRKLRAPLDVVVVRKLGAPGNPELGLGALAPGGIRVLDAKNIDYLQITNAQIAKVERIERRELKRRTSLYRSGKPALEIKDKVVILVDDGMATGISMLAAVKYVILQKPAQLIVAVPVCSIEALTRLNNELRSERGVVVYLEAPLNLTAISQWYREFAQVTDAEVNQLLLSKKLV